MDLDDNHGLRLFLEVYGTLPRAGPGGDQHTLRASSLVPGETPQTVLDLGCGPGAHTVALAAALPDAQFVAVDILWAMVDEANRRFSEAAIGDRAKAVVGDMATPGVEPRSQDLIWCEGAIYNVGVSDALRSWQPLLRTGGTVAFTEAVWLVDSPPKEVLDWWSSEYSAMSDGAGVRARIEAAAYRTVASFVLPAAAWWDEYYQPMQSRIAGLEERLPADPVAAEIVAGAKAEIDYFRRFCECYSYEFFIVQPTG